MNASDDFMGFSSTPDWVCSTIRSAQDTATAEASFRSVMAEIASPRWAKEVASVRAAYAKGGKDAAAEPKKKLPGVLFSGTFSRRAASALVQHSGLICADLDELGDKLEATFELVASDPHTLACFRSPTGTGLKVVCRVDPAKPHADSFRALEHYMLEHFALQIDQACKDVSRICFVSHDPEAFSADDAVPLPYPPAPQEFTPSGLNPRSGLELTPGDDYDARGDFATLLTTHGWSKCPGGWTRPGKTMGLSATFDKVPGRFYVFSSSVAGFEPQHVYRPWHVYAILVHGGDFAAAARALGAQGFGHQKPSRQQINRERITGHDDGEQPSEPSQLLEAVSATSFGVPLPGDDSILIGDRWLSRGDGAVLSSTSGMGKSSISLQLAYHWALDLQPFNAFKPNGPLKSLFFQAEDSAGDVGEVNQSLIHAMKLTAQQVATVGDRVKIVTDRIHRGAAFAKELKRQVEIHKPDIVWINPLQSFMDGDVKESVDLGQFLREYLNGLNHPAKFAYFIIHHTTKPPQEKKERQWNEVMYDMAGGAEIVNWARAIVSLRASETEGQFNMILAKRGRRAGATELSKTSSGADLYIPTTTIPLRHSPERIRFAGHATDMPLLFWERTAKAPVEEKNKGGRPTLYHPDDMIAAVPAFDKPAMTVGQIHREVAALPCGISERSFKDVLARWVQNGEVERVQPKSPAGWMFRRPR